MLKVCVFTGSRAEYSLLYPLLKRLKSDETIELQLLVTGTHLSREFGFTVEDINDDAFDLMLEVDMLISNDTPAAIVKSMGVGLIGFAGELKHLNPDLAIVLGDRFEMLAAAQACLVFGIPIVHIHGGEVTLGAIDESIRHAISKLSYLHLVATEEYRARVIQLGEQPERVHAVGALGVENIKTLDFLNLSEIEEKLGRCVNKNTLLVTLHPETGSLNSNGNLANSLVAALSRFPEHLVVITGTNADPDGAIIHDILTDYANSNRNVVIKQSLGGRLYLSLMKQASVVVGNSSSGIIEAPSVGVPAVDIGDRQKGRTRALSTRHCEASADDIHRAILEAQKISYRADPEAFKNPYDFGVCSDRMKELILSTDFTAPTSFHDIQIGER